MSWRSTLAALLLSSAAALCAPCRADDGLSRCAKIENADERLACYDALARPPAPAPAPAAGGLRAAPYLTDAWKLGPGDAGVRPLADILPYRPNYIIFRWTDRPNSTPRSPGTGRSSIPDLDHVELRVQGSLKTELVSREAFDRVGVSPALRHVGFDSARLWFAYTQKMNWQSFNRGESRPISDTNYEPELILTLGREKQGNGFKLVNLGASHESNGLDPSEHREWNRLYVQPGWDWNGLSVLPRLWYVIPGSDYDNPNIRKYMGDGDLVTRYETQTHYVGYLLLRHNFSSGRGFMEFDWATPVFKQLGGLKFFAQFTAGYGETLIDYNHHQATIGAGVSFADW